MKSTSIARLLSLKFQANGLSIRRRGRASGFSLLELLVVITIILILMGIAVGRYERSVLRSKEAALHHDLFVMRTAIQQYTLDKEAGPTSLDDLVSAKYMSGIPKDPVSGTKDWHTDSEQILLDPGQNSPGITDVHSSSAEISPFENTAYNTW
jgi:general secretion pathway protein G